MEPLSETQIAERLEGFEWGRRGDAIERDFELADFAAAVAFINRVAELAEAANHHPDILLHDYKQVRFTLSTHAAGGLTESDFTLAAQIDAAAA